MLVLIFSQYLKEVRTPVCSYSNQDGWKISAYPFFEVFPVGSNKMCQVYCTFCSLGKYLKSIFFPSR